MSVAGSQNLAPRPSTRPLAWALLISASIHFVALVVIPALYVVMVAMGILARPHLLTPLQQAQKARQQQQAEPLPLEFVEVDPSQAVKEAPKNAKYYSSRNAVAANPNPKLDTQTPKIDGKQTHVVKTETTEKPKSFPLQPSQPKPPAPEGKPEPKPRTPPPKIGDLAMVKPPQKPSEAPADAQTGEQPQPKPHVRPRTLAEVDQQNQTITGQKMHQEGGVKRSRLTASFDTRATTFGAYDAAFIQAVQQHWYDLIDANSASEMRTGRVVLEFNLNYDGRITDMKVIDSDVNDLMIYMCQRAVLDPAPFEKWPSDMRRTIGSDVREVRFSFYYQ